MPIFVGDVLAYKHRQEKQETEQDQGEKPRNY